MSKIQRENLEIARRAVIGCGGRIVKELILEDGTHRLVWDGCDPEKLRIVLTAMVPDMTFNKISRDEYEARGREGVPCAR